MRGTWKTYLMASLGIILLSAGCGGAGSPSASVSGSGRSGGSAIGIQGGVGISNSVKSPSEMNVGDLMGIEFQGADEMNIDFEGADPDAEYILIVGSANAGGFGTAMQVTNDINSLLPNLAYDEENVDQGNLLFKSASLNSNDVTENFHNQLREAELDVAEEDFSFSKASMTSKGVSKSVALGEVDTFQVLSSISSVSSFVDVDSRLECLGERIAVYVDTRVSDDVLSAQDIEKLCAMYDRAAGIEDEILGASPDVDGDGVVHAHITYAVNSLGAHAGGIVTGYFWAGHRDREVVHLVAPDPNGSYGPAVSKEMALNNFLPAVFPHELQHLKNYYQRVGVQGVSPDEAWKNEGLSHLFEDVVGWNMENYSRYDLALSSPSSTKVVAGSSPNLLERGASYLFLRFLYEQSENPNEFLRNMVRSELSGVEAVQEAFDGPDDFNQFSEFFGRWTVAVAMTNRGVTADSRYTYKARTLNAETQTWQGVCLICEPDDGRGTVLEGVYMSEYDGFNATNIKASAAKYYQVSEAPSEITLKGTHDGGNFGVLIRTK
ncbi:MAG: hypothetical protein A3I05_06520 [Deltaproteobacteria bacterium RIFCSPLOWO2_02_FULL_44_10]|nr:MAG: hypothetical protein A3C46_06725 [Deltaproteobacteria bacterium RIFCSPHIGHO2_02_FULL_44_16]OGQ46690.1 MAG: hypothetical protein A3I05_06520 [Deltaproteobacteria bacterium RIFCSPLOWO2_02_FULL_44_10]